MILNFLFYYYQYNDYDSINDCLNIPINTGETLLSVLYTIVQIQSSSISLASGSSGDVTGSITLNTVDDLDAYIDDSGTYKWFVRAIPYAHSWCNSYSSSCIPTYTGNTITMTATLVNPYSITHSCTVKWAVFVFKRIHW